MTKKQINMYLSEVYNEIKYISSSQETYFNNIEYNIDLVNKIEFEEKDFMDSKEKNNILNKKSNYLYNIVLNLNNYYKHVYAMIQKICIEIKNLQLTSKQYNFVYDTINDMIKMFKIRIQKYSDFIDIVQYNLEILAKEAANEKMKEFLVTMNDNINFLIESTQKK